MANKVFYIIFGELALERLIIAFIILKYIEQWVPVLP